MTVLVLLALQLTDTGLTKAYAAGKTVTGIGTGTIGNPQKAKDSTSPWVGNYVYYSKR